MRYSDDGGQTLYGEGGSVTEIREVRGMIL
jgi:hypothetical protein